jgi:hypothetical protein
MTETISDYMTIFAKFCGDGYRDTGTPFVQEGYLYATDTKICIRVPSAEPSTTGRNLPAVSGMAFWSKFPLVEPQPLPLFDAIPETAFEPCWCKTGRVKDCRDCQGTGEHECDCEECDCLECRKCDGRGVRSAMHGHGEPCQDCDGQARVLKDDAWKVPVGYANFDHKYTSLLATLPGVRWELIKLGDHDCMLFESGDCQGVVMAMHDRT